MFGVCKYSILLHFPYFSYSFIQYIHCELFFMILLHFIHITVLCYTFTQVLFIIHLFSLFPLIRTFHWHNIFFFIWHIRKYILLWHLDRMWETYSLQKYFLYARMFAKFVLCLRGMCSFPRAGICSLIFEKDLLFCSKGVKTTATFVSFIWSYLWPSLPSQHDLA